MRTHDRTYHFIYKTTCTSTGKFYVGMHSTDDIDDGYIGSGKLLWHSINKHGRDAHFSEILEFCDTRELLRKREAEIVNLELLALDECLNLKLGGEGGMSSNTAFDMWNNPITRKNIIAGIRSSANSEDSKERFSKEWKQRWQDPAFKDRMSNARKMSWREPDYQLKQKIAHEIRHRETNLQNKQNISALIKSGQVDFTRFGWVQQASVILNTTPQNVNRLFKRFVPEFYSEKCFKRKKNPSVA